MPKISTLINPFPNRYKEQKSRLNLCGIKVKYYLVEEAGLSFMPPAATGTTSRAIDRNTLDQAISNTCIRDGFKIRRSNSQNDSCKFLQVFTRYCLYTFPSYSRVFNYRLLFHYSNGESSFLVECAWWNLHSNHVTYPFQQQTFVKYGGNPNCNIFWMAVE